MAWTEGQGGSIGMKRCQTQLTAGAKTHQRVATAGLGAPGPAAEALVLSHASALPSPGPGKFRDREMVSPAPNQPSEGVKQLSAPGLGITAGQPPAPLSQALCSRLPGTSEGHAETLPMSWENLLNQGKLRSWSGSLREKS